MAKDAIHVASWNAAAPLGAGPHGRRSFGTRIAALGAALACWLLHPAVARGAEWELSLGADGSTGRYGATADTTVQDVRVEVRYQDERLRLEGSLPYIWLRGPGELVGGVPTGGAGNVSRRSGIGDLSLSTAYLIRYQSGLVPAVELGASVKIPTAPSNIGTSKADFTVSANAYSKLAGRAVLITTIGYSWLGTPKDYDLNSGLMAALALNHSSRNGGAVGVSLNYRAPFAEDLQSQLTVAPYVVRRLAGPWGITLYGVAGLTSDSPRWGGGLKVSRTY